MRTILIPFNKMFIITKCSTKRISYYSKFIILFKNIKLCHSGKKTNYMRENMISFINTMSTNKIILKEK